MKAVILAGGRGKRLRPVTDYIPKPLVPINNIPILEWQIKHIKRFEIINEIIVCSGYMSSMIENYLSAKDHGIKIRMSVEDSPLGTGGAIKKTRGLMDDADESFVVLNGDIITDIDIGVLASKKNSIASVKLRTNFGIVDVADDDSTITGFKEKGAIPGLWMNAGVYHLEIKTLDDLPDCGDIEKTVFPTYANKGLLYTVKFADAKWYSIDSFKDMEECAKYMF